MLRHNVKNGVRGNSFDLDVNISLKGRRQVDLDGKIGLKGRQKGGLNGKIGVRGRQKGGLDGEDWPERSSEGCSGQ